MGVNEQVSDKEGGEVEEVQEEEEVCVCFFFRQNCRQRSLGDCLLV